jgi:hypothetical protein
MPGNELSMPSKLHDPSFPVQTLCAAAAPTLLFAVHMYKARAAKARAMQRSQKKILRLSLPLSLSAIPQPQGAPSL